MVITVGCRDSLYKLRHAPKAERKKRKRREQNGLCALQEKVNIVTTDKDIAKEYGWSDILDKIENL